MSSMKHHNEDTPPITDCLFCKILNGEIPSKKIYEDDNFVAILDIYPIRRGHAVLLPKKHYRWVQDVEPFEEYWSTARKVANLLQTKLSAEWMQFFTFGHIPHAHIHILPRYENIQGAKVYPNPPKEPISGSELEKVYSEILES